MHRFRILLAGLALVLLPGAALAQELTITLDGPGTVFSGAPGDTIDVPGTIFNSTGSDITMDNADITVTGPSSGVTGDPTPFYLNFLLADPSNPGLVPALSTLPASGEAVLFTIAIDPSAVSGGYAGDFVINDASSNPLGDAAFTVNVEDPIGTPEPGAGLLLSAMAFAAVLRRSGSVRRRARLSRGADAPLTIPQA